MTIGPVQLVVLGFEGNSFTGEILAELRRLRDHDVIRLIDLLLVSKDESGEVTVMEASDLTQEEAMEFGATVGALIGLGEAGEQGAVAGAVAGAEALEDGHVFDAHEVWYVTDSIPNGSSAAGGNRSMPSRPLTRRVVGPSARPRCGRLGGRGGGRRAELISRRPSARRSAIPEVCP